MAEMTMPDAARRRADLIELLQPVHLGSEAASVLVEVHGWKGERYNLLHYVEIPAVQSQQQSPSVENANKKKVHM